MYVYSEFSGERADCIVRMTNSTGFFETSMSTYNPIITLDGVKYLLQTYNGNKL